MSCEYKSMTKIEEKRNVRNLGCPRSTFPNK